MRQFGPDDEPVPGRETTYPIWVVGPNGRVSEEYEVTPHEPHDYELVSKLFEEAKKRAIDSDTYLQMLDEAAEAKFQLTRSRPDR